MNKDPEQIHNIIVVFNIKDDQKSIEYLDCEICFLFSTDFPFFMWHVFFVLLCLFDNEKESDDCYETGIVGEYYL